MFFAYSGAAFTRFQTLRLRQVFPNVLAEQLISYGSCQFPTLGFVVERYKQVQAFIPEPFWKLVGMYMQKIIAGEKKLKVYVPVIAFGTNASKYSTVSVTYDHEDGKCEFIWKRSV